MGRPALRETDLRLTVIQAGKADRLYFRDLWVFRELFYILVWRDILVRYKQTAIGLAWTLLRPLLTALVFALVFGKLVKVPSGGMPHAPFIYIALVPWLFFASAVSDASMSLSAHASLISKVYFPRIIVPLVATAVALIDMLIAMVVLLPMLLAFGIGLDWKLAALVPLTLLTAALAFGLGAWFAALHVRYKDTAILLPFVLQFGLYLSPVIFPSDLVPHPWRLLYSLNPMVGIIEGFRWAAFPGQDVHPSAIATSVVATILILVFGLRYFRGIERGLADVI
ncbi:MAG: ABC transporter permease [Betaproteobacteria bacterium]|nr:ABC transporter permease [Betaproteobacteria bacterium]